MDEVLIGKADIIERCLQRIDEEYVGHENELATNFTRQDSIILNLQRACEASIDAAMHLVRIHRLGLPNDSRQAFEMIEEARIIKRATSDRLKAMVGFRNIAMHNYRGLDLDIVRLILAERLGELRSFARLLLRLGLAR